MILADLSLRRNSLFELGFKVGVADGRLGACVIMQPFCTNDLMPIEQNRTEHNITEQSRFPNCDNDIEKATHV